MQVTRFPERASGPAERMAGFIAHLRMNGVPLGPAETGAALQVLTHVEATDVDETRLALKTLLSPDADVWGQFDDLFNAYWFNKGAQKSGHASAHVRTQSARPMMWKDHLADGPSEDGDGPADKTPGHSDEDAEGIDGRLIATQSRNLTRRDLRELFDEADLQAAEKAAERLAHALRDRRSRRRKQAKRGEQLDMRRIQRASVARGGEPLDLFKRKRPDRPMNIIALTDVSGSMTVYSRVFLAFVRGLISRDTTAEAFLFHTRLMRVTDALRERDTLKAASRLSLMAEGFGGGTDIGGSLSTFVDQYSARLNKRTVVLILSDGYCTGTPEKLGQSLKRIRQKAGRVVWLNPLLGWKDYEPVARAIQEALPHVDAHLPVNTIDALAALEPEFARL